jgi:hypothetical protein
LEIGWERKINLSQQNHTAHFIYLEARRLFRSKENFIGSIETRLNRIFDQRHTRPYCAFYALRADLAASDPPPATSSATTGLGSD